MISPEWSEVSTTSAVPASHRSSFGSWYVSSSCPGNWPWLRNACSRAIAGTVIGVKPALAIFSSAQPISLVSSSASRALEAISPAARHLRHPRQVGPVVLLDQRDMVERLEVELGQLALGADDLVEALVRPDRRALVGNAGQLHHQRLQLGVLAPKLAFQLRRPRAGFLGLAAKLRLLFRRRILELRADRVALGPQPVDLGLCRTDFGVERQQRIQIERPRPCRGWRARPPRGSP